MHIVFVCWGNICRSPAAEATFKKLLNDRELQRKITCDSAGTISQHHGNPPDSRMQKAARMVTDHDFENADFLITMDHFNFSELSRLAPNEEAKKKILTFCDYVSTSDVEVPDPYYGGGTGFEKVLDLLEDGCTRLLEELQKKLK